MPKIPKTIASQHPDHASKPYWLKSDEKEFISTKNETEEVFLAFKELGIEEYKWDWEGKFVDESVIERLFSQYYEYFKQNQIGIDKFITYRLPNPTVETEQRLGRAFMGILSAAALAKSINFESPPMQQVILPMCNSAQSIIEIQEAFREIASLKHWLFSFQNTGLKHIQVIPLFEDIETISNSDKILAEYIKIHADKFGYEPSYLRPYVARSDPSLNSGHIATVLAIKIAFSKYLEFETKTGIELYPMIGCAALPFRGGLTPLNVKDFLSQYSGVRTILIQSAFRYDYSKEESIQGVKDIQENIPNYNATILSSSDYRDLKELMKIFEAPYREKVENLANLVNFISKFFPSRRERVQHVGLFGYSRGVGKVTLPRAIKFTGCLYSIGLPPTIIGMGKALKKIVKLKKLEVLNKFYVNLIKDYQRDARFVNLEVLEYLAKNDSDYHQKEVFVGILEDVKIIKEVLKIDFKPITKVEIEHQQIVKEIAQAMGLFDNSNFSKSFDKQKIMDLITKAGICRKSLG
jgi:phosphoenolpyruvate carboxylase